MMTREAEQVYIKSQCQYFGYLSSITILRISPLGFKSCSFGNHKNYPGQIDKKYKRQVKKMYTFNNTR